MPLSDLIDRARQGDAAAIARLITRSLVDRGVVASARWQGNQLHILLEADAPQAAASTVPIIRRGLRRLQLTCPVDAVLIVSRQVGQTDPQWQDQFRLEGSDDPTAALAPPTLDAPDRRPAPDAALLSDHALLALAQLMPLFSYLVWITNGVVGLPLLGWGGAFLFPWRIVPPLVVLLVRGQTSEFARQQSKRAINFQLSMVIYWIVTIALMFVLIGFLMVIPLALVEIICIIIAAVKSSEGKPCRYPLAIPFVR